MKTTIKKTYGTVRMYEYSGDKASFFLWMSQGCVVVLPACENVRDYYAGTM